MKTALLTGLLMAFGAVTTQSIQAAPSKVAPAAISQIVITSYTGSDAAHPKAEYINRLLLKSDGTAIYVGNKTYSKRVGRYRGTVSPSDFAKLAKLFQRSKFQSSYINKTCGKREVAKEIFQFTSGGQQKTITSYDQSGSPQAIKKASAIASGLMFKIRWTKVSSSDAISG